MKKSIKASEYLGFFIVSLGGSVFHYLYEWFGKAKWIAPLSCVNESTWEHLKLLFWPSFFFALVQRFFFKEIKNFWCIKLRVILIGIVQIPALFFCYNGVIGPSPSWFNISSFFIAVGTIFWYETKLLKSDAPCRKLSPKGAFIALCVIAILFGVFTFLTPEIALFKDPITGTYGI